MTDISPENRAFYWSTIFLRALVEQGVCQVVISPGSRSTPLTMAAAAMPALQTQVVLDERSAAFLALGIGKATGRPAPLICTSGTAVANYFPAVIEARKSGVPLLLLTADRPPHLRHTGANQTIEQQHIFGQYPIYFHDLGEPRISADDIQSLQRMAARACEEACRQPGPAHLNFPFRKPLEPENDFVKKILAENPPRSVANSADTATAAAHVFSEQTMEAIRRARRPLIIIGQLSPRSALADITGFAAALNIPVLSEQGIGHEEVAVRGYDGFLRDPQFRRQLRPDLLLRFGRQPASKSVLQAVKQWKTDPHLYFSDFKPLVDISGSTTRFIDWSGGAPVADGLEAADAAWLDRWKEVAAHHQSKTESVLASTSALTDAHVYHQLAPRLPDHWYVFISNSFPARDQSLTGRWKHNAIYTNRGASGIDGITSTAMGIGLGLQRPGILFTGDLAFLHDSNALLNHRQLKQPLVVVVLNNGGGSIFRMLPVAEHDDYFETYFETPQQVDIESLAAAHSVPYQAIRSRKALGQLELSAFSRPGLHIVECITDAGQSMEVRKKLWGQQ